MLAWLERYRWFVLALTVVAFAAAFGVSTLGDASHPPLEFRSNDSVPDGTPIRVDVAGAVAHPGVYDLVAGQRVVDAVTAAGGAATNADTDAVNLARRLRDGEQVVLPTRTGAAATKVATLTPGQRLDLNSATAPQLDQLPGIGSAYAQRIVDSRSVDGPFQSVDDLVSRKVLPKGILEGVRDRVGVNLAP